MIIVIVWLGIVGLIILSYSCVPWLVHISMTKRRTKAYGWGSFKKFKREYNKHKWETIDYTHNFLGLFKAASRFDSSTDSEVHASIVKFDGKGMFLDPFSMILASNYMKKFENKKVKKERIKW